MNKLNWKIVLSNINEAREEMEKLEKQLSSKAKPTDIELELSLRHAYHHLNFAWNIRHIETEKYANMTDSDFRKWGKYPAGFDDLEMYGNEE